ncbi:ABC transporter ATP-binding protein [Corynebacterium sp. ED61]|uniref:ABC transporter ATP-binding protein n=1 Tax=Corynebacterium sp. ED61 TaxID=2211360 RepID=UPI0018831F3A|nr:ABC transporter ATP-binding protein [Corynebacterium sp. ED61]MBF0580792.1 ABC transporter ATP-binding protein [Corynebacterium sp. ED61]
MKSGGVVSDPTVVVESVTKRYTVRDTKADTSKPSLFGKSSTMQVESVKNVSLVAIAGESIGLIGKNGSGKSSLLKLIAGGESPTEGRLLVRSRPTLLGVSPALQVYLTGEQNIYLGCLAIGMSKAEAQEAVPKIAEWAEIGDAIKRPMNTYSAGQGARLIFAISTAIDPEILLIDEALSTGDASFAKKAERRMKELLDGAGNLFLVSHSTGQIEKNCERAIWLDEGSVIADGKAEDVCSLYSKWSSYSADNSKKDSDVMLAEIASDYRAPRIQVGSFQIGEKNSEGLFT